MVHDYSAGILALCAVMRDQRADIREWVDYHYLYGVDKFYIFDDDSKDPALDILQDYISNGVVHYIEHAKEFLGVEHPLQPGFDYCIKEWGPLHKWMGFIDIDEFILRPGISIPDVLERYAASAAVALNWKVFGSSGFEMRPGGVAHYTKCTPPEAYPSYFVKCIVQPRHTIRSLCVGHEFEYHPGGRVAVNVEGNSTTLKRSWSIPPAYSYLYINHYQVKSKQEFFEMKIPRGTGDGNSGPNEEYFQHIEAAATADCMPLQWPRPRTVGGG
ncbi:hypothetical protein JKP88DRAFT_164053 [Tribonema minus]|uniref:Glycosyltransferase family 92 protein n=1 Tax=Tribonema minus TaxID=303371 RepID=A0A835YXV8_9STRA|nr:hypothetical protein JKP88DRAFT_164053 [Tribonema minus]